jgi:hypothetical protein
VSSVIRGGPEDKNGLALRKGFKIVGAKARIIHDTNRREKKEERRKKREERREKKEEGRKKREEIEASQ